MLILGGTTEASDLARRLAGDPRFAPTLSLAGRTRAPIILPIQQHSGGFGGAEGLADWLRANAIAALIDATHPFAVRISANAAAAASAVGLPFLAIERPEWTPEPGDRWTVVPSIAAAADTLGPTPTRVLLTIGRQDLAPFAARPWHEYTVRSVDPPPPDALPGAAVITARGPFEEHAERRLFSALRIEVLVTKNAGGTATLAKLAACRALGIPVVMVARPPGPPRPSVPTAAAAMEWLARTHAALRGV